MLFCPPSLFDGPEAAEKISHEGMEAVDITNIGADSESKSFRSDEKHTDVVEVEGKMSSSSGSDTVRGSNRSMEK